VHGAGQYAFKWQQLFVGQVRMATCWVVINLTYCGAKQNNSPFAPAQSPLQERARCLAEAGMLDAVKHLLDEACVAPEDPELKQRAKIALDALEHFG
jgi:hypothetical protein